MHISNRFLTGSILLFLFTLLAHTQVPDYRAENIIITKPTKKGTYSITELSSDSLLLYRGILSSIEPEVRHGKFYFFDDLGNISATGYYNEDVPFGTWVYYNSSFDTLHTVDYSKVWQYLQSEESAFDVDWETINAMKPRHKKDMLEDGTFTSVPDGPEFGEDESGVLSGLIFGNYIRMNIQYPIYATKLGLEGVVKLKFVVDANGDIKAPSILEPSISDFNIEALRLLSESPKWKPGRINKAPVNVVATVPVHFSTDDVQFISEESNGMKYEIGCEENYSELDSPPLFQGNDAGDFRYHIARTLNYPERAAENGITGRVVVQFVINTEGSIEDITIIESADPDLDGEAIRVVKTSPKWVPAKLNGEKVSCTLRFPFNFVLQ